MQEAGIVLLILGVLLGGGTLILLGYAPHALPITCGRRAAVQHGRERGVRQTAMYGGLATGPRMKLSSGCFVGPEPIEGES